MVVVVAFGTTIGLGLSIAQLDANEIYTEENEAQKKVATRVAPRIAPHQIKKTNLVADR